MIRVSSLWGAALCAAVTVLVAASFAENLEMTTYYPAPAGNYKNLQVENLRVVNVNSIDGGDVTVNGNLTVTGVTKLQDKVGIGMDAPISKLQFGGRYEKFIEFGDYNTATYNNPPQLCSLYPYMLDTRLRSDYSQWGLSWSHELFRNGAEQGGNEHTKTMMYLSPANATWYRLWLNGAISLGAIVKDYAQGYGDQYGIPRMDDIKVHLSPSGNSYLNGGNVGIGTTNVLTKLHVNSSSSEVYLRLTENNQASGLDLGIGGGTAVVWNFQNTALRLGTNNTERMRIAENGNVGIGTLSPAFLLDVKNQLLVRDGNFVEVKPGGGTYGLIIRDNDSTYWGNLDANDEFLAIGYNNHNGPLAVTSTSVGIGTTAPQAKLDVRGNGPFRFDDPDGHSLGSFVNSGGADYAYVNFYHGVPIPATRSGYILWSGSNMSMYADNGTSIALMNGYVGIGTATPTERLHVAGNALVTGTVTAMAFYHTSDQRLKDNIVPVDGALEKVLGLQGVYYNFKADPDKKHVGLIAQDVETVVPEAVVTGADDMKAVDYDGIVPLLIEAVKAQQMELDAQKKEIEALKARIGIEE